MSPILWLRIPLLRFSWFLHCHNHIDVFTLWRIQVHWSVLLFLMYFFDFPPWECPAPHFTSLCLSVQPALFPAHPCWGHGFPLYRDSRHSQALECQLLLTNRLIQRHCFLLIANQQQASHRVTCPVSHICLSRTWIIYFWTPGVPSLCSGCFKLLVIPGNKGVTNTKQY